MNLTSEQIFNQIKDVQVLSDAKNFKKLDTMNVSDCMEDLRSLLQLMETYKNLTETNTAAGTLYRDLCKKYFTADYQNSDEFIFNVKGLPGVTNSLNASSDTSNLSKESEIASQCKQQYQDSAKETNTVLKQLTNVFGKLKRDMTSLINDCTTYFGIIDKEIEEELK